MQRSAPAPAAAMVSASMELATATQASRVRTVKTKTANSIARSTVLARMGSVFVVTVGPAQVRDIE